MKAARDSAKHSGRRMSAIILSSARPLKELDDVFRDEIGKPEGVVSTAAVGCLLSLTPGALMGISTLRKVLFDLGLVRRVTPYQRFAYRLIASSGEFDLPWSRRCTLENELRQKIFEDARDRGEPVTVARKKFLKVEDPERSANIVAQALDRMAVTPKMARFFQRELEKLKKEKEQLSDQLADQKRKASRK